MTPEFKGFWALCFAATLLGMSVIAASPRHITMLILGLIITYLGYKGMCATWGNPQ